MHIRDSMNKKDLTYEEQQLIKKQDICPVHFAGIKTFLMHDKGSSVTWHPEECGQIIEVQVPKDIQHHEAKLVRIKDISTLISGKCDIPSFCGSNK